MRGWALDNRERWMIFRAILGMGLVLLLLPRQPDRGLEWPGLSASLSLPSGMDCGGKSCASRTLADVKAEIDASIRARGTPHWAL